MFLTRNLLIALSFNYSSKFKIKQTNKSRSKIFPNKNNVLESEKKESVSTLGQHLPQLEQRMNLTCPRPCLLRPPFLRLNVCKVHKANKQIFIAGIRMEFLIRQMRADGLTMVAPGGYSRSLGTWRACSSARLLGFFQVIGD